MQLTFSIISNLLKLFHFRSFPLKKKQNTITIQQFFSPFDIIKTREKTAKGYIMENKIIMGVAVAETIAKNGQEET